MFNEVPFLERIDLAARAGFPAVECLFPYSEPAEAIARRLKSAGLLQVLFNGPPGDWDKGERGFGALPHRRKDFRASVERALQYAEELSCPLLHLMAGIPGPDDQAASCREVFIENLQWAAPRAENAGVTLMLEPLNPFDMPGYFLNSPSQASEIIAATGCRNVAYQYDVYHVQMSYGRLTDTFRSMLPLIRHIQVSGVPGRCEPDDNQEINFTYLFEMIAESDYDDWVGCEYLPRGGTEAGLAWYRNWLRRQA